MPSALQEQHHYLHESTINPVQFGPWTAAGIVCRRRMLQTIVKTVPRDREWVGD